MNRRIKVRGATAALAAAGAVLALSGCEAREEAWRSYRQRIPHEYEEHTETLKWKEEQEALLEQYAKADDAETYQIPVSVAIQAVAKDPELLAPVVELKTDLSGMSLAQKGEQHFKITYACAGCHSMEGNRLVGPALNNRWGDKALLEGGEEVVFDDEYFKESVLYSRKKIARGYPPAMPVFNEIMPEEDYEAIKAYVMTYQE